jgi:multidrug efflux pump
VHRSYELSLDWALAARWLVLLILVFVVGLNVFLFVQIPKGFFPQQDTGQINGGIRADQSISFQAMQDKLKQLVDIIRADPAVDTVVGFTGGSRAGGGFMFINLKPAASDAERGQAVIARLRPQLARVTGVSLFLNPVQDLRMGGARPTAPTSTRSRATTTPTSRPGPRAGRAMKQAGRADRRRHRPAGERRRDLCGRRQGHAARLGITSRDVDNALYNNFGQRQVATIYAELNQYNVILGWRRATSRSPEALKDVYVPAGNGGGATVRAGAAAARQHGHARHGGRRHHGPRALRPTSSANPPARRLHRPAVATAPPHGAAVGHRQLSERPTATSVNHQDSRTGHHHLLQPGRGRDAGDGQAAVRAAEAEIHMPINVRGSFQGTARRRRNRTSSSRC